MKHFIRYGFVGIGINCILYTTYLLISYLGLAPRASMTVIYIVGVAIGYYSHRQWTFGHDGAVRRSVVRYGFAHLIGYSINFFLLLSFVDHFGYPHEVVQGAAIVVVAAFLFVVYKYWVFPVENIHATN